MKTLFVWCEKFWLFQATFFRELVFNARNQPTWNLFKESISSDVVYVVNIKFTNACAAYNTHKTAECAWIEFQLFVGFSYEREKLHTISSLWKLGISLEITKYKTILLKQKQQNKQFADKHKRDYWFYKVWDLIIFRSENSNDCFVSVSAFDVDLFINIFIVSARKFG